MHKCEFCNASFLPRPQVKRPRACGKCQVKRQRENEKEWRINNKGLNSGAYFRNWRLARQELFQMLTNQILALIKIGITFQKQTIDIDAVSSIILEGLVALGVRHANKLYPG